MVIAANAGLWAVVPILFEPAAKDAESETACRRWWKSATTCVGSPGTTGRTNPGWIPLTGPCIGSWGDEVALLRVTTGAGRRAYTGYLDRVRRVGIASDFEPAADPDAGFASRHRLRTVLSGTYWSVRRFV